MQNVIVKFAVAFTTSVISILNLVLNSLHYADLVQFQTITLSLHQPFNVFSFDIRLFN